MGDIEVAGQAALKMIEDAPDVAAADAVVGHDHVRGQNWQGRGQGPGVEVVHRGHFGQLEKVAAHLLEVDVIRGGLQKDSECGAQ